ncbi:hypothetical protein M8181_09665 [Bacillus licheniformis]|nr:hypothetical protein LXN06_09700 [Bacillus licheniformis]WIY58268.1 hypothetical protein M8181_09665 [Bacillus licheniformis]
MKRHHFSYFILLTCLLTLAACSQTSKENQSSDDQETVSTEENSLTSEEKSYRESIKQLTESMGTALDSLEVLNEPQGNSENIEQSKQDTVITMFSIIKTSESLSCPSDRFRDVCVDYDSMVSSFQDIYDKLPEAYDDSNASALDDITSSLHFLDESAIKLKKDLQKVPSE